MIENNTTEKISKFFIIGGIAVIFIIGVIRLADLRIHTFSGSKKIKAVEDKKLSHYGFEFLSSYEDCLKEIRERFGSDSIRSITQEAQVIPNANLDYPDIKLPQITFLAPYQGYFALTTFQFSPITRKLDSIEHKINISSKYNFFDSFTHFYHQLTHEYGPAEKLIESLNNHDPQNNLLRLIRRWWKIKDRNYRVVLKGEYCGNDNGCGGVFIFDSLADIPLKSKFNVPVTHPKEISLTFYQTAQSNLSKKEIDQFIEDAKRK